MKLTARRFINPHKFLTPLFIIALMVRYENYGTGPLVYLALHGAYCINWFLKEMLLPDKGFDGELPPVMFTASALMVCQYWWSPWILITSGTDPHKLTIFAAVVLNIIGTFLHFGSDTQKYYTLQIKKGLITNGFFARSRNPNYLGEFMTYLGFAILAEDIIPIIVLLSMVMFVFVPLMWQKDKSMSRYDEFAKYKQDTYLIIPKLFR